MSRREAIVESGGAGRRRCGAGRRRWASGLALGGVLTVIVVLWFVDPAAPDAPTRHFIPPCTLRATTGFRCPGCGLTRMTHQLLHGHWAEAWALNPLGLLLVPVALVALVEWAGRVVMGRSLLPGLGKLVSGSALTVFLAALLVYGVARNLVGF